MDQISKGEWMVLCDVGGTGHQSRNAQRHAGTRNRLQKQLQNKAGVRSGYIPLTTKYTDVPRSEGEDWEFDATVQDELSCYIF